jgi:hypothetical protein
MQVKDEVAGLLVHLVYELVGLLFHPKNLPLWTKPTPLTLESHWASLSLFILSSSALTHSLLVSVIAAPDPTCAILSSKSV